MMSMGAFLSASSLQPLAVREPEMENLRPQTLIKGETVMTIQAATVNRPQQDLAVANKIKKLRDAFADAPQIAKTALENKIHDLAWHVSESGSRLESAGRTGSRQGKVSELTLMLTFAPGGAQRLRALLQAHDGNFDDAAKVGTVHNMRFVFLDNDTKLLFATAYDGDWDPYIDDFATKIPDIMDLAFSAFEGWPGIHSPKVKDWIAEHQIPAEGWYVAHPDLSVAETDRAKRTGKAVEEFLDKIA